MKKLLVAAALILFLGLIAFIWWQRGLAPADKNNNTPKIFVIEEGSGVRQIANELKKQGLIKDQIVFFLLTKKLNLDKEIEAGSFRLFPSMTAEEIAKELTHGTLDIWITIPEGMRAEEIDEILAKDIPTYDESWGPLLEENEGYLFPDTYLIPRDTDISQIIKTMRDNFDAKFATLNTSKTDLSKEEIVTLASLIEREARHAEDRPKVASVITNRLDIGMKLDIDATLQYALGYQKDEKRWWKGSLTNEDKAINSPYNTYRVSGFPPSPISNPGLASLEAAVYPANTSYIYYITDKSGTNRYATDLEGHQANIEKYGL
ncbi:MAG: endolytic transglycosylase MltG [Candidatus Levybacteria bacterium]|nr:endolytic transglycosylase MltG [Candidatus Levybacteria bacterium]